MPIPTPQRYSVNFEADPIGLVCEQEDPDGEYVKWSEVEALLLQRAQEIAELKAVCEDSNAVCVCGCPVSEHDSYGEDGEACEHDDHECVRTSKAVYAIVHRLRAKLAARAQEIEQVKAALRSAWEEGFQLCRGYGDNHAHFYGEQKERQWRAYLERLRADAALVSRAPQVTFSDRTVPSDHPAEPSGGGSLTAPLPASIELEQVKAELADERDASETLRRNGCCPTCGCICGKNGGAKDAP